MNETKINKYTFFIGSNNKTKKRELSKAKTILNKFVVGYNINLNIGLWNGFKENSFKVEVLNTKDINTNDLKMLELKKELTKGLNQYLVLLEKSEVSLLGDF
jgi:hypothetical protein